MSEEKILDIISKKRDGKNLSKEDIQYFINEYTYGNIPDYQASALLMAIYINGMTNEEIFEMTMAMADSGERLDLSGIKGFKADKHSTGGVGDKTTLVVTPIVAACGVKVAKMSGRGLGHNGGTVDKLEAIPGMRMSPETDDFIDIVNRTGMCVVGQTGRLAPADKKIYALRDVTATVESIPLIASSIMSKKIAAGSDAILLDVKVGSGAFMKDEQTASKLAEKMIEIGTRAGIKTAAVLTDMDEPLGYKIGNSLEVEEAVSTLKGQGPQDLTSLCIYLSANMLYMAGIGNIEECTDKANEALLSGAALEVFRNFINAQGGNTDIIDNPEIFPMAKFALDVFAKESGYIVKIDTQKIGNVSVELGAGRLKKEDKIDISAGLVLSKKIGDYVESGDSLATLYTNDEQKLASAEKLFLEALTVSEEMSVNKKIIIKTIGL